MMTMTVAIIIIMTYRKLGYVLKIMMGNGKDQCTGWDDMALALI